MAAKWQKWMPFHIDRFMGSLHVQAMHPAARAGYIYLLAAQWQSDDSTVANDEYELSVLSGMGQLWKDFATQIMRHFVPTLDGRLRNTVLFDEWTAAKQIFDARRNAAGKTNSGKRDGDRNGDRTTTKRRPQRSAHTRTDTDTETSTKRKPSGGEPPADERHNPFRLAIFEAWPEGEPDWNGREGSVLGKLLAANPKLTLEGFRRILKHRRDSEGVNLYERPCLWLEKVTSFAGGPLDRYGKPLQAPKQPSTAQLRGVTWEEANQR